MEDFGYKKTLDLNQNKTILSKKIFYITASLISISIFFYISIKAYHFISNSNIGNIETIKGAEMPIKITENNEYEKTANDSFNSSIYENILNRHKNNIEIENIKINKHQEPAYPPINNKEITKNDDIINNLEKNIKKNNNSKSEINEIVVEDIESKPSKSIKNENKKPPTNASNDKIIYKDNNLNINKVAIANSKNNDEIAINNKISIDINDKKKIQANSLEKKYKSIRVQISAMSSKQNCEDYYGKLANQYSKLFSKRKSYIEEANLGKRGLFYRLQVGDFFNQIEAEEFCLKFISQTQKSRSECIIVE